MKYANIDSNGRLLGWYDKEGHGIWVEPIYEEYVEEEGTKRKIVTEGYYDISNIPDPKIEVSEEQWQKAIDINANYFDGSNFSYKDFRKVEEIEKDRVRLIKEKAGEIINSKYPFYKQLNITNGLAGYDENDKQLMISFIEGIRKISDYSIKEGVLVDAIIWEDLL